MPRIGLGGGYVGLGVTDWATDGGPSDIVVWFRLDPAAEEMGQHWSYAEFSELTTYDADIETKAEGRRWVQGTVSFGLNWAYGHDLFRVISGEHAVPVLSAPGEFSWHNFNPPSANESRHYMYGATERGVLVEVYRGDDQGRSVYHHGCLITQAAFDFRPNDIVKCTLSFVGRKTDVQTKTTPVFPPAGLTGLMRTSTGQGPHRPSGAAFLRLGTTDYRAVNGRFVIDQPVDLRWGMVDRDPAAQPKPHLKRNVTLDVEVETGGAFDNDATLAAIAASPIGARFTGAQLFVDEHPYTSPNYPYPDAIWALVNPVITGNVGVQVKGIGVVTLPLSFASFGEHDVLGPGTYYAGWLIGVRNFESAYH